MKSYYKRKKRQKRIKLILFFSIIFLFIAIFYYAKYEFTLSQPIDANDDQEINFIIKKGESLSSVAQNLQEKSLIADSFLFNVYARLNGLDTQIKSGRFHLSKSMNAKEIAETLINPETKEAVVTIPEGSTIIEIDQILTNNELIEKNQFVSAVNRFNEWDEYPFLNKAEMKNLAHPLEGYLFPDTYFVDANDFYSENLIQVMLNTFEEKAMPILNNKKDRSLQDTIIMASIIEKEVRTEKDIPIVSGILWKRLDENWFIGADATLLYLADDREITYYDLQEDSPYNTRNRLGLPPGPISNPGIESIEGAVYPEDSPYYYYLTTLDTGEVIYAETEAGHNKNKAKYL
ncbi:endolytic transglycosylase MltG [Candidatus Peregrinibacteria bacterium]|nr:endolytic transglycosylase MltG [Candidatus Peregrinibacteria bacterium]